VFELRHNRFLRNSTEQNGGGVNVMLRDMMPLVSMQTRGNVFRDNVAKGDGGAIHWAGGSLAIAHSVFRGNRASTGSAVFARTPPGAVVTIANTLVVESSGAAIDVLAATIVNTTIARNQGRAVVFADGAAAGAIANTIFDQNAGGNCVGVAAGIVRRGNIQFGAADCPGVTVANPNLDALFVPAFGSAATEIGDGAICSAAPVDGQDLLLQRRGRQRCSSGAYERPPVRAAAATPITGELCADGTRVRPGQPCAAALMICPGGQSVPFGATCPCQPHGLVCSMSSECCNGVPCTSGRCRFP
jgi:predicted outer membrane repeat protein